MGNLFQYKLLLLLAFWLGAHTHLFAQLTLSTSGTWSQTLSAASITEAGNDFEAAYASAENQVLLGVTNGNKNSNAEKNGYLWSIYVSKSDVLWDNTVQVYARRTDEGTPRNSSRTTLVSGGTTYQQITETDQWFFWGYRGSTGIPIQYQLQGVTVLMPAQIYRTTIVYTVTSF